MAIGKFLYSNVLYILWFILYFTIAWVLLGADINSFIIVAIIYGISISLALSPLGEIILRLIENCREPATEEERNYLMPLFEEAYQSAKEINPGLNNGIRLYIMDAMYINAFAIGRRTIAVTMGAVTTFTADELKGILAHELGHMAYGHTKALLLSVIGNLFFSVITLFFKLILIIIQLIASIVASFNVIGFGFAILAYIARLLVNISVFIFINLSQMILAINSRTNEIQADTFGFEMGYGRELISGLYLLHRVSLSANVGLFERMKASHPHMAYRIANLEYLENTASYT